MKLEVTKIERGGVSTINKVRPCVICNQYTPMGHSPLGDVRLWLTTPKGANTYGCVLSVHMDCLRGLSMDGNQHSMPPANFCHRGKHENLQTAT